MGEPFPAPDDAGGSLAQVLPSAAAVLGVPGYWDLLGLGDSSEGATFQRVIVVLVDGLGLSALRQHAQLAPFMTQAPHRPIVSAVPSTTPTGLATLGTGLPPGSHGLVGASFMVEGHHGLLHPLNWQDSPSPVAVQPESTVFQQLSHRGVHVTSVGPRLYAESGLTLAALRGGDYRGADSVGERIGELLSMKREQSPSLTYVYWPDLDKTGHGHGVDSDHWRAELQHVDYLIERIAELSGPEDLLVVTADHGMVDVEPENQVDIDRIDDLRHHVLNIGGEPRCRFVYTRPGHEDDVAHLWREHLSEVAWVMTRSEAIDAGLFGAVDPTIAERIGNVVAFAKDGWSLTSQIIDSRVSRLRGQHGSITAEETQIPLITVAGGGRHG